MTVRRITVIGKSYCRENGPWKTYPDIQLRGKWLADAGFKKGHTLEVAYENRRLVITLAKEQRFDGI